ACALPISTWNAPVAGGTQGVTVTANSSTLAWTASSNAVWLTVSPTSGTGSGSVTLTAASTTSFTNRTGTVTLGGQTVSVTQAAGTATLNPTTWNAPVPGGTRGVTVAANSPTLAWTASSNAAWLTVSPTSGTGSGSVTL